MQNGTQIIITNCEPSIHLGTSHPGGRGSKKIGFVTMNLLDPPWGSVIFVCLTPFPPPPFPLYWQLVGSQFYTVLPLCILLMTNAPSEPLPLKTCDPPQTNTPPYPPPPPPGHEEWLFTINVCVDCVDISVHKYIFIYFFFFFFLCIF